jgi:hypothetical protein
VTTTISAKVSQDLDERIEKAREEGETKSAAIGRLIRDGLEAHASDQLHPASFALALLATAFFFGSPEVTISLNVAGVPAYAVGLLLYVLATLLNRESVRERLTSLYTRVQ